MTDILLGLLGAVFGAVLFLLGYLFGSHVKENRSPDPAPAEPKYEPSEEDLAEIEKQRERLRQEQAAFHDMMGYSADVAYGRQRMPGEE